MVQGSKPATYVTVLLGALALLVGTGFLAPATGASSGDARASATARQLSVAANPTGAVKGKSVAFSGTLTKSPRGSAVAVQRKIGKKWVTARSTKTSTAAGRYLVRVKVPTKVGTYSYRAVAPAKGRLKAVTSKVVKVSTLIPVTATITAKPAPPAALTAGAKATLTGAVKPFVAGSTVSIQRFASTGRWVSSGTTATLSRTGRFTVQVVVKEGSVFRVSVPRRGLRAPAVSGPTAVIANPAISTTSLPNGVTGAAYNVRLTQVGANPGTWSVSPALPAGLALNKNTGVLAGTPTVESGAKSYTFSFAQPGLVTATKVLSLAVVPPPPPVITTTTLPDATVGVAYSHQLTAQGNPAGTWTVSGLPSGLSYVAGTGLISGTPTTAGNATAVHVEFTQTSTALSATPKDLTLTVLPPPPPPAPVISTTELPVANGSFLASYSAQLAAVGSPDGTWTISGLPNGFSLNATTGVISKNPLAIVANGSYPLTVGFSATGNPTPATPVQLTLVVGTGG